MCVSTRKRCCMWRLTGTVLYIDTRERKILRNIFGPVYNSDLTVYEKRHNEELYCLYRKPNVLTYARGKRLEWLGHVWRSNGDILNNVLTERINKQ